MMPDQLQAKASIESIQAFGDPTSRIHQPGCNKLFLDMLTAGVHPHHYLHYYTSTVSLSRLSSSLESPVRKSSQLVRSTRRSLHPSNIMSPLRQERSRLIVIRPLHLNNIRNELIVQSRFRKSLCRCGVLVQDVPQLLNSRCYDPASTCSGCDEVDRPISVLHNRWRD